MQEGFTSRQAKHNATMKIRQTFNTPIVGITTFLLLLTASPAVNAQVLYDGALGTVPGSQGWTFFATGGTQTAPNLPTQPYTTLNTTGANAFRGGYTRLSPLSLNRVTGYTFRFDVAVSQEAHTSNDRAGFSAIIIGSDLRGIELGFWGDRVFAQNDGIAADDGQSGTALFTHGEEALLNTSSITRYDVNVIGNTYALSANTTQILTGNLRDYSAFNGPINPYVVANDLFLGDDTTSARANLQFQFASVSAAAPDATPLALLAFGLPLLGAVYFKRARR